MSFLGAGFLAGLFGIVLPLAIHFFAKRRRVNLPWGAMRFLEEAKPSWKRRSLRLQDWLVLLMRIAAVACLALAFARPLLKLPVPPTSDRHMVLIVDRSPSTELGAGSDSSLRDEIDRIVAEILEQLPEETGIRIFVNGSGPGLRNLPPATGRSVNESRNRTAWLRELKSLRPGADTLDWSEAIQSALDDLPVDEDGAQGSVAHQVLIVADAAAHGWPLAGIDSEAISEAGSGESPASIAWNELMAELAGVSITLVPVGADHPQRQRANLCVDRVETDQQRTTSGGAVSVRATISNRGMAASLPAIARWSEPGMDSAKTEAAIPALEPGAAHELMLRRTFLEAGPHAVQIEIDLDDALAKDNTGTAVIEIVERLRVAVVTDSPPDGLDDPDDRFSVWTFGAAAGDSGELTKEGATGAPRSVFDLEWLSPGEFSGLDLNEFAMVVWSAGLSNKNLATKLRPFISKGGGLWLRPPRGVEVDGFNEAFFPHEYGLSPAAISSVDRIQSGGGNPFGLRPAPEENADDPLAKYAFSALSELQAKNFFTLREPLPPSSRVLAEFEGGNPFVVTRQLGRGQVILTTLDSHPKRGNLASCVGYVPLVREMLWRLSDGRSRRHNFAAGDSEAWRSLGDSGRIQTPTGEWLTLETAGDTALGNRGEFLLKLASPGLYWIDFGENEPLIPVSIGGVPDESNLRPVPKTYFEELRGIDGLRVHDSGAPGDMFQSDHAPPSPIVTNGPPPEEFRSREIWGWLLAGLLGFLVLELLLAQRLLSRRRKASGRRQMPAANPVP